MKLGSECPRVPCDEIQVERSARQRRELFDGRGKFLDPDGLLKSIAARGVLSPILVTRDLTLVFGERRWTASSLLNLYDIPVRYVEELTSSEFQILELEENLRRSDVSWSDRALALARLHALYLGEAERSASNWDIQLTANQASLPYLFVVKHLRVARALASAKESPSIATAQSINEAYNSLVRADDRATADALGEILDASTEIFDGTFHDATSSLDRSNGDSRASGTSPDKVSPRERTGGPSVLVRDFHEWARAYIGPKFNLVHCDFPYGIGVFKGPQGHRSHTGELAVYLDTPEIYEALIRTLCEHTERLVSSSAHLVFWLAADIRKQYATLELFRALAPSWIFNTYPLVWHKTDNVGVLPDATRGPRRVYETALLATRGDRPIVRAVANAYGSPTDKTHHPSTKPEPMLRHYFSMLVDENTRLLDPTCGSGSALRAAEGLGAAHVLGLEKDPEHAKEALRALDVFRTLREAAGRRGASGAPSISL